MQLSFKTKTLLVSCPVIVLISIAYTMAAIRGEQVLLRDEIVKRGEVLITMAVKSAELPLLSEVPGLLETAASSITEVRNVPYVTFYRPSFIPIIHAGVEVDMEKPSDISAEQAFFVRELPRYFEFYGPVFSVQSFADIDMFEDSGASAPAKEHLGWVRIGISKKVMEETVRKMAMQGAMFALLLVAAAVVVTTVQLNFMFRPLNALFDAVKNLREGEYPKVQAIERNDEIGQLAFEFDKMSHAIMDREQQLKYSQKRISDLFDRVEHAVFRLASDFKVLESNRKFNEICRQDVDFFWYLPEEKRELLKEAATAGQLVREEVAIASEDGEERIISLSIYPEIAKDGSLVGFDGHFVDISEIRRAEEERILLKTQVRQAHEAGMAEMAAEVLHNIGNALTPAQISVMNMIKSLRRSPLRKDFAGCLQEFKEVFNASSTVAPEEKKRLALIVENLPEMVGRELEGYLAEIIKISEKHNHIENIITLQNSYARLPGYFEFINLNMIVDDALQMMDESLQTHGIQVEKQCGALPVFRAEKAKLIQVLMNLIKNGQEATYGNPANDRQLTISTRLEKGQQDFAVCSLKDNGCGFTAEEKSNLFSFGYTSKKRGFGFGLHSCANYLNSCGGSIEAHSDGPGLGSEFIVSIPVSVASTPQEEMLMSEASMA